MDLPSEFHAPFTDAQGLGTLTVTMSNGDVLLEQPLVTLNAVEQAGFFSRLWDSVSLFFLKLFGGDPLAID